ncbi:monocarboxylate transporter 5-like [Dermacentor albipictus]|uniref:monocarboxylate transporter 5-like n=1 Tax=Dermacentor albipictus TaxID=60249 RepID=UPI0038FD31F6
MASSSSGAPVASSTPAGMDSRRSWVVLAFLSWCMMMTTVSVRAAGVIYVGLVEHYHTSREEASLPLTIHMTVLCSASLVGGYLCELCSFEAVALGSVLITSASMMICYFAPSIDFINFFFGVVHGGATSGIFVVANVLPSLYFKKWRATATSIVWSSQCYNVYFIPQLANFFRVAYGTPELFLLIGALCLNALPACIVIKTPPWALRAKEGSPARRGVASGGSGDGSRMSLKKAEAYGDGISKRKIHAASGAPETEEMLDRKTPDDPSAVRIVCTRNDRADDKVIGSSCDGFAIRDMPHGLKGVRDKTKLLWKNTAGALLSWKFYVDGLSYSLEVYTMSTYFMVYADMAVDKGLSVESAVYLLHAYSTADLAFRVLSGWFVDRKYLPIECSKLAGFVLSVAGAQAIRTSRTLVPLIFASLLFGCGTGINIGIIAPLLQHDFKKESLAMMFGGAMFITGLVILTRPPVVGYFRDTIGDYDGLFHTLTVANAIFAVIWLVRALVARRQSRAAAEKAAPTSQQGVLSDAAIPLTTTSEVAC